MIQSKKYIHQNVSNDRQTLNAYGFHEQMYFDSMNNKNNWSSTLTSFMRNPFGHEKNP